MPRQQACQCPDEGVINPLIANMYDRNTDRPFVKHEPGQCKCTNDIRQYVRKGKKIWLCSCCHLPSDKPVK